MALTDYKITEQQMDENGVISAPDTLTGTAAENKAVFDKLIRKVVDDSISPVLDTLAGALGAANVGATTIEGLEGTDVQALLAALKALRDADSSSQGAANATVEAALADRYTKAQTDGLLGLKFDAAEAEGLLRSITFDPDTGVFTLTRQDGTSSTIDTLLEKVAVNFELVGDTLVLTLQDGSKQQVDLSSFIDTYTFTDTDTVGFSASGKDIQAQVKNGSITAAKLDPQVTEGIAQQAELAQTAREGAEAARAGSEAARDLAQTAASTASAKQAQAAASAGAAAASAAGAAGSAQAAAGAQAQTAEDAVLAQSYAVGGTGTRPGEDTDNAKYYKEQAAAIVGGDYATPLDVETAKQEAIDTAAADASSKATAAEAAAKAASVPTSRTVNGHALDADLVLGAADVGAVPTARTVNGHALSADVELTAADVGAVPTGRTVNGHALTEDIELTAADVGALTQAQLPKALPLEVLRVAPLDVQVLGPEHLNKYLIVSNQNMCVIQVPGSLGSVGDEVYITGTADALLGIQPYGLDMATIRSAGGKTTTQTAYTLLVLKKIGEAEWILQGGLK